MEQKIGFHVFVMIWNAVQGYDTPEVHFKIADWLEDSWKNERKQLLLMAFRASGKSTLVGLFAAWLLLRDPNLRLLVLAADMTLAKKMVRNVKRIIERHPATRGMKPEKLDQWGADRFTVTRARESRDPSVMAAGVMSNITGSRADVIICDDVEVPNTCDSAEKRAGLRERLAELSFVQVDESAVQLYIGTPHTYYTIYADEPRLETGEAHAFLADFDRLKLPVVDEAGQSAWPERFSKAGLERLKVQSGPNKFSSQMMLEPVNIVDSRLNPKDLVVYGDALSFVPELKALYIGETQMVGASAFWDPAFGGANGDSSVLAVVFADDKGRYYLHRMEYVRVNQAKVDEMSEAEQQCRVIASVAKELRLPSMGVEINGIGKFLPGLLRNTMSRQCTPCKVIEVSQTKAKDLRILESLDALMAAQRLHVHRSVLKTPFISEMQEWHPGRNKGHDDGLDALAGALMMQPVRLPRLFGKGAQEWMRGAGSFQAEV